MPTAGRSRSTPQPLPEPPDNPLLASLSTFDPSPVRRRFQRPRVSSRRLVIFKRLLAQTRVARDSLTGLSGAEWMAESFLEEQLQRIRKLTERMSQVHAQSA